LHNNSSYYLRIWIDGQLITKSAANADPVVGEQYRTIVKSFRPSEGKKLYLKFESNCITDDQTLATKDAHLISNLGTIKVELRQTTFTDIQDTTPVYFAYNQNMFDEKTKKGLIDHAVGGTIKPSEDIMSMGYRHGALSAPLNFIFAYRSKKWLQAEDFIEYVADENNAPTNGRMDPIETAIRATYFNINIPIEEMKIKVETYKVILRRNNQAAKNNIISIEGDDDVAAVQMTIDLTDE